MLNANSSTSAFYSYVRLTYSKTYSSVFHSKLNTRIRVFKKSSPSNLLQFEHSRNRFFECIRVQMLWNFRYLKMNRIFENFRDRRYTIQLLAVAIPWTDQWLVISRQVWHQSYDSEGMDGLVGLVAGYPKLRIWKCIHDLHTDRASTLTNKRGILELSFLSSYAKYRCQSGTKDNLPSRIATHSALNQW